MPGGPDAGRAGFRGSGLFAASDLDFARQPQTKGHGSYNRYNRRNRCN